MGASSLVALEEGGAKKCGLIEFFVFFQLLYFSAAAREMWLIRRVLCCMGGGSV